MAYDFDAEVHSMEITDGLSGDIHKFFYELPGNKMRLAYSAAMIKRRGRKLDKEAVLAARIKFGAAILTGFEKGTFKIGGALISSDPNDKDFYPEWKKLLTTKRSDLVSAIGFQVFEGSGQNQADAIFDDEEELDDEPQAEQEAQNDSPLRVMKSSI